MRDFQIRFVTRPGCHLCEQAAPVVERVSRRLRVRMSMLYLDDDDELIRLFSWRIPVVLGPDDEVLAEGLIDEARLRKAIRRLKKASR